MVVRAAAPSLDQIRNRRAEINAIAARYGVDDVRVFGSVARGEARPGSDVDVIVRLAPGQTLLALGGFQYDLQTLLGCYVDVVTEDSLEADVMALVLREARRL